MIAKKFEDVIAWQKARVLTIKIYNLFKYHKDFGFKDQIQRASISIMNNIAEGFERQTNKDMQRFLYISKGSSGEVRSMLYIAKEMEKISEPDFQICHKLCIEISKILSSFINGMDINGKLSTLNFEL